jgi:hypothetical protein
VQNRLLPVEGIVNLFTRAWWSRTWVLQELSVAQKAGFVCGTKWLSRRRCTAALNAFIALRPVLQEMGILKGAKATSYQRSIAMADFDHRATVILSMWITHRYDPFPLLALLRATCIGRAENSTSIKLYHLEATDPRDKIYGLLGLAADRDELKEFGVQPDYTQSCQGVYISATAAMLRQGHLSLLSLNQFPKSHAGLPSWVPDWFDPLKSSLQAFGIDHMTLEPEYNASGSLIQTEPRFNNVGAQMSVSVSGFVYDKVHEIGITWDELYPLKSPQVLPLIPAKRLLAELARLSFLQGELYKTVKERISAAARTVAGEIGFNDNGRWERIGNQRYRTAASLLLAIRMNDRDEMKLFNAEFLELIKSEGLQPEIDMLVTGKYMGEIEAKARGRKPFVTAKGHIGLGSDHVVPGDAIAVLASCQVPFVLRQSADGKYEIVGKSYLDGIMDGEAVVGRESVGAVELC